MLITLTNMWPHENFKFGFTRESLIPLDTTIWFLPSVYSQMDFKLKSFKVFLDTR